jgi:hypothetical protein
MPARYLLAFAMPVWSSDAFIIALPLLKSRIKKKKNEKFFLLFSCDAI